MAFTLEATLVIPLSLSLLCGLTGLTLPILSKVDVAARNSARAQIESLTLSSLYQWDDSRQFLITSPQHLVEWIELIHEAKLNLLPEGY